MNDKICTLTFDNSAEQAKLFSQVLNINCELVHSRKFPDEEILLSIPPALPEHVVMFRSLHQPNDKIIEILLAAKTARKHNAKRITLIAPYLCYMRQDIENKPGEAISQQIIGELFANTFDDVITVDSHLHRIDHLDQAIPIENAINIMATDPMSDFLEKQCPNTIIFGPDGESEQWVSEIAENIGGEFAVAQKVRRGDKSVKIEIPDKDFNGKDITIVDDMASTGRTIALATQLLKQAGAKSVNALVTHALFMGDAKNHMIKNGVENIWSTDTISDPSNKIQLHKLLADSFKTIL